MAGWQSGLSEEVVPGLRMEASVGVEWFQTKGVAGTNALQVGAKSISRAEISQVKLKGKDNHTAFDLTIELGRISEIKCNQLPQFIGFIDKPRTLVLLMLH